MKEIIRIPVKALVELRFRGGDLGGPGGIGVDPLQQARDAHRLVQKSRPSEYKSEERVSITVELKQFTLIISGRMDGIFRYPDRTVVEEIKTTSGNIDDIQENDNPAYWAQALIYAYIHAKQNSLQSIDIQLTYFQLKTRQMIEFARTWQFADLEEFFLDTIKVYSDHLTAYLDWQSIRYQSIVKLAFPFSTLRKGQQELADNVSKALSEGCHILIQAPPGLGKTLGIIYPAVKSMAQGLTTQIFYLSARTTGKTSAQDAILLLKKSGLRLKWITITAKEKACLKDEMNCSPEYCEYARGYFDRLQTGLNYCRDHSGYSREFVDSTARKFRLCPFEFSLDLSLLSDMIICDYNYVFDPRVFLRRFFQPTYSIYPEKRYTLLIDEAHNMVDRAREMYSAEIRQKTFANIKKWQGKKYEELFRAAKNIDLWFQKKRQELEMSNSSGVEQGPPEKLIELLSIYTESIEQVFTASPVENNDRLIESYFDAARFIKTSEYFNEKYIMFYARDNQYISAQLFCADPHERLKRFLDRSRSAIFFSATLLPIDYYRSILGLNETAETVTFPSPFPSENLIVLQAGGISTRYRQRSNTASKLAELLLGFVGSCKGNYFLYFPSYKYMHLVYNIFISRNTDADVIIQQRGMSEKSRTTFLEKFSTTNERSLVGFAVMGGVFSESIDLVGNRLTGAAVIGVGLPGISVEREIIKEYYNLLEAGYEYAYLYPGISRVLQAVGRVVRSENDRGAVLLVDDRFSNDSYKQILPEEWNMQQVNNSEELRAILEVFWKS